MIKIPAAQKTAWKIKSIIKIGDFITIVVVVVIEFAYKEV